MLINLSIHAGENSPRRLELLNTYCILKSLNITFRFRTFVLSVLIRTEPEWVTFSPGAMKGHASVDKGKRNVMNLSHPSIHTHTRDERWWCRSFKRSRSWESIFSNTKNERSNGLTVACRWCLLGRMKMYRFFAHEGLSNPIQNTQSRIDEEHETQKYHTN